MKEDIKIVEAIRDLETNVDLRVALSNVLAELDSKDDRIHELETALIDEDRKHKEEISRMKGQTYFCQECVNKDKQIEELNNKILRCPDCEKYMVIGTNLECELHKQDKVIEEMTKWIEHKTDITVINKHICKAIRKDKVYECNVKTCIKCIKQYFENQSKNS